MTPDQFRAMALALEGTVESAHMGHPDFRLRGKVFASLGYPDDTSAMVKLTPEQQTDSMLAAPNVFAPCAGAWGRQGSTSIHLPSATAEVVQPALEASWRNLSANRRMAAKKA
jgi:hypothetical protein